MTKREVVLQKAREAGYHGDGGAFTRLRIQGRVSLQLLNAAWAQGEAQRERGVGCNCYECTKLACSTGRTVGSED